MTSRLLLITVLAAAACGEDNPRPLLPDASAIDAPETDASAVCVNETGTPPRCFDPTACEPQTTEDILNGCTDASCIPFDNVARLPRYNNGTLPTLP